MHVIGLVGEKGSGKGTFVEHLKVVAHDTQIFSTRFSDLLRETLTSWHIPHTRANLQKIAVVMDEGFGAGTFSNAVYEQVRNVQADAVVLDGVRWDTDAEIIRRFPVNTLVYITASPEMRYERLILRGENAGERDTTLEQFLKEEQAANELLIPKIGAIADYVIKNEGTVEEYKNAVFQFYQAHLT